MWRLELVGGPPRLDRPETIHIHDGLTVGRGNADVLLDSGTMNAAGTFPLGAGMGRVHALLRIENGSVIMHCKSLNKCRVEGRQAEGLKADKNIDKDKSAQLTDGCTVIFASRASASEWRYVLRKSEPAFASAASQPSGYAASAASQAQEEAEEEALAQAEAEAEAELLAMSQVEAEVEAEEAAEAARAISAAAEAARAISAAAEAAQAAAQGAPAGAACSDAVAASAEDDLNWESSSERGEAADACGADGAAGGPECFEAGEEDEVEGGRAQDDDSVAVDAADDGDDDEDVIVAQLASAPRTPSQPSQRTPRSSQHAPPDDEAQPLQPSESALRDEGAARGNAPGANVAVEGEGASVQPDPSNAPCAEPPSEAARPVSPPPCESPPPPPRLRPFLKQLRAALDQQGVSYEGCIEKADLAALLRAHLNRADGGHPGPPPPPLPAAPYRRPSRRAMRAAASSLPPPPLRPPLPPPLPPALPPRARSCGSGTSVRISSLRIPYDVHLTITSPTCGPRPASRCACSARSSASHRRAS